MKKYKWPFILFNLALVLFLFNWSVIKKEKILKQGQLVLLELAPKDPRSIMQGDYMSLRYAIAQEGDSWESGRRGYFVVTLDKDKVAQKKGTQYATKPLNVGEFLIKFRTGGYGNIHIGAESYFFEEGKAEKFEKAKFGGLKVAPDGNSILIGLYDEQHRLITP